MNNDIEFLIIEWRTWSQIFKTILDCMPFFRPNMCGFLHILLLASTQTLVVNWKN